MPEEDCQLKRPGNEDSRARNTNMLTSQHILSPCLQPPSVMATPAVHHVWCGEGQFPAGACQVKPLSLRRVRPEKSHVSTALTKIILT